MRRRRSCRTAAPLPGSSIQSSARWFTIDENNDSGANTTAGDECDRPEVATVEAQRTPVDGQDTTDAPHAAERYGDDRATVARQRQQAVAVREAAAHAPRPSPRFFGRSQERREARAARPRPSSRTRCSRSCRSPSWASAIHDVLHDAGLHYTVPTQITLATGLDSRMEDDWRDVVKAVFDAPCALHRAACADRRSSRTAPSCLRVVDQTTMLLRDDLNRALRASGLPCPIDT